MIPSPPPAPLMVRDENGVLVNKREFIAQADVFLEWIERFAVELNELNRCSYCGSQNHTDKACDSCGAPK